MQAKPKGIKKGRNEEGITGVHLERVTTKELQGEEG
jgi:hypothetical protein